MPYLKRSMSFGFCSQLCSGFSLKFVLLIQSLCHSLSPCENMAVIFSLHLKSIGVVKDLDT